MSERAELEGTLCGQARTILEATRGDIADQQFTNLKIFWQALLSAHLVQNKKLIHY